MNTTPDLTALMSTPIDDTWGKPAVMPAGTYHGVVTKFELGKSAKKGTPYVKYTVAIQSAGDDIDPQDLVGVNFRGKAMDFDFYITPDAKYRFVDFHASCGNNVKGMLVPQAAPEAIGKQVMAYVKHETGRRVDPITGAPDMFPRIDSLVGA